MNEIYLTFDYELFLGFPNGGVENCLIDPTNKIIDILKLQNVEATFYVDFAYLFYLNQSKSVEFDLVQKQLKNLIKNKHSIQFHLHPHWMYKSSDKDKIPRFYIDQYSLEVITDMISDLLKFVNESFGLKLTSYRAGGLINNNLLNLEYHLMNLGFQTDSSVLDFQNIECQYLKQHKISTTYYTPFFYWKLIYQRYFGKESVTKFGKGNSLPMSNVQKLRRIFLGARDHLSFDSNKWTKTEKYDSNNKSNIVILSHPKAMNQMSLLSLSNYIIQNKKIAKFKAIR